MDTIKKLLEEHSEFEYFADGYFEYLHDLLKGLDKLKIKQVIDEIEDARSKNNTVFVIGNGGSAATACHIANDFCETVFKNKDEKNSYRVQSLTDNIALMTAIANDDGYDKLFVNQLRTHYRSGDKLLALSTSGNSENIVQAAKWVKERGGKVMSMVGFDGGKLVELSDVVIHAKTPNGEYGPVEDIHMIMDHLIITWLQRKRYAL